MAKKKKAPTKHRFICSPNDMLIVVNVEKSYYVSIVLYVGDMIVRRVSMRTSESTPSHKKMRDMVNHFCNKFTNQKHYSDPEIAEYARDLSSVTDIYGLRVWRKRLI